MKSVSTELKEHLASDCVNMAVMARVTRQDGQEFFFSEHDQPIDYDGDTYEPGTLILSTNISSSAAANVDNMDINVYFDSDSITVNDLRGRLFNMGNVTDNGYQFSIEVRSLAQALQQDIGFEYGPDCDANLGDSRCKFNLASETVAGTLTGVTSNSVFTDSGRTEAVDWFKYGVITFTSGNNSGQSFEVGGFTAGQFTLFTHPPFEVQVGDTYSVYAGCDKLFDTCKNKFDNVINFRGFPYMPGIDRMVNIIDPK